MGVYLRIGTVLNLPLLGKTLYFALSLNLPNCFMRSGKFTESRPLTETARTWRPYRLLEFGSCRVVVTFFFPYALLAESRSGSNPGACEFETLASGDRTCYQQLPTTGENGSTELQIGDSDESLYDGNFCYFFDGETAHSRNLYILYIQRLPRVHVLNYIVLSCAVAPDGRPSAAARAR